MEASAQAKREAAEKVEAERETPLSGGSTPASG
jgi:hypothetical protein